MKRLEKESEESMKYLTAEANKVQKKLTLNQMKLNEFKIQPQNHHAKAQAPVNSTAQASPAQNATAAQKAQSP